MFFVVTYFAKEKGFSFFWDIMTFYGILLLTFRSALSIMPFTSGLAKTTGKKFWLT